MFDTIRNATLGQILNHFSNQKILPYPEERADFVIPQKYLGTARDDNLEVVNGMNPRTQQVSSAEKLSKSDDPSTFELTVPVEVSSDKAGNSSFQDADQIEKGSEQSLNEKDPGSQYIVVDWYDDNDQENPQNWSLVKKCWIVLSTGILTLTVYMGSSIFTPGIPQMMEELNTTRVKAILPLTVFVLGYGIGPMFLSPLSEHPPIGRTYIYIITLAVFCVLQVPTALADTIEKIIGLRLVAGLFASPALSTGAATLGDTFSPHKLYIGLLLWAIAAFNGPSLGPLLGGVFTQLIGWRWTFWFLCIASGFTLCLLFVFLPETNAATLLHRRAARLRKLTGNQNIRSPYEVNKELHPVSLRELAIDTLWRPIFIAFGEPIVFILNLYCAFLYILLNSWFEAFPLVFNELYGFNLIEGGLAFLSVITGASIGAVIYLYWVGQIVKDQNAQIERFLLPAMGGAFLVPIGLFIFSWGASTHSHFIAPCIGALLCCVGSINIFQAIFNYLGRGFYFYLASVFAGNCLVRSWAAAVFPIFVTPMFTNLAIKDFPVGPGGSILGGIGTVMIAIPFVIYKYGVPLRGRSKYAVH